MSRTTLCVTRAPRCRAGLRRRPVLAIAALVTALGASCTEAPTTDPGEGRHASPPAAPGGRGPIVGEGAPAQPSPRSTGQAADDRAARRQKLLEEIQKEVGPMGFSPARKAVPAISAEEAARLEALGYLDGVEPAPVLSGVVHHDAARAQSGLNFFVDGHAPVATLLDMDGNVLHQWSISTEEVREKIDLPLAGGFGFLRRAHLTEEGDVLAIFRSAVLLKLDRDSKLQWVYPGRTHHDLYVHPSGEIDVLGRERRVVPFLSETRPVWDDVYVRLAPDGQEKLRVSILDALERGGQEELLAELREKLPKIPTGDILHTNTITPLDGSHVDQDPAFAKGNLLLSSPTISALMILDPRAGKIVWERRGTFRFQHDPTLVPSGSILLFDNQRGPDARSAVVELDPETGEERWAVRGSEQWPLYSRCCGTAQRLANGNTLIAETGAGRALEVDREGEIVWEYYSPHRTGDDDEFIAQLFDMVRYAPDYAAAWLPRRAETQAVETPSSSE